jgi:hypothetical protein
MNKDKQKQERAENQKTEFNPSNNSEGQNESNEEIKARIEQRIARVKQIKREASRISHCGN